MKKVILFLTFAVFVLGLSLVSCENDTTSGGNYDPALNGNWEYFVEGWDLVRGHYTYTFSNGNYTYTWGSSLRTRGTYTTSGNNLRLTTTAWYADSSAAFNTGTTEGWKNRNQITEIQRNLGRSDAEINEMLRTLGFFGIGCTYSISGDILTLDGDELWVGTYQKK